MLMVIFGAGASYDSVPTRHPGVYAGSQRPPLADDLFADRDYFVSSMTRFPDLLRIVPLLQQKNVEQVLEKLQSEVDDYPARYRQLAAVRFYLHDMITECQNRWNEVARGISNYKTLLDHIERWLGPRYAQVCLVTFNYDTLLEEALPPCGVTIKTLDDYITNPVYKLIKVHGSINWARQLNGPPTLGLKGRNLWTVVQDLIAQATDMEPTDSYHISGERPIARLGDTDTPLFPALAIPFVTKLAFECPADHLAALRASIPEITRILIIGWRGVETHFVKLLSGIPRRIPGMIVSGSAHGANEVQTRLAAAGLPVDFETSAGGFTDFVVGPEAYAFLRRE